MSEELHGTKVCIYSESHGYMGLADLQKLIDAGIRNYENRKMEPMTLEQRKKVLGV